MQQFCLFFLDEVGFYERNDIDFNSEAYVGKGRTEPFRVALVVNMPQQSKGDCGVFITTFAEYLIEGRDISADLVKIENIDSYRRRYATNLYMYGLWKNFSGYVSE
ncbi:uncharacterized protein LOC126671207 [Mercurialis annua]|uniref:uncharacterized protein LOC126671207 n=1 Tax=Mercurialis annua TaxID=3986 RepID=UPI00215F765D|nr:uncharacterized protein LOC126671207 [Mercurialis annua]